MDTKSLYRCSHRHKIQLLIKLEDRENKKIKNRDHCQQPYKFLFPVGTEGEV